MVIKWLKQVVSNQDVREVKQNAGPAYKSKAEDSHLLDVVHEAMRNSSHGLSGLVNMGQPLVERQKMKEKIKNKVKGTIAPELDSDDVVEEVTERILDSAEFDPHYAEMFDD